MGQTCRHRYELSANLTYIVDLLDTDLLNTTGDYLSAHLESLDIVAQLPIRTNNSFFFISNLPDACLH